MLLGRDLVYGLIPLVVSGVLETTLKVDELVDPACGADISALSRGLGANDTITVVVDVPLSEPGERALCDLERALSARGFTPVRRDTMEKNGLHVVVGVAGRSNVVDRLLAAHHIPLAKQPGSLCIRHLREGNESLTLIAGADERGLSYAILEAARAVELVPEADLPLAGIPEATESPYLRVRSMTVQLFNADLEAEWYFDEEFWAEYFQLLARCRYNNFTLTFSHQTNYLTPVYAYLVDVPEFSQVTVKGLTPRDRQRNLAMLKRITEMAEERGLDFTLGIWTQLPVEDYSGEIRVTHLPTGLTAANYCGTALRTVLQACPAIDAVQFRMNAEAGVSEDQQTDFYRPLFRAIGDCGRAVRVDLRYKGLRPETIQMALAMQLDVTVSTKFWCEHMGLPYHPMAEDTHYRESRYGYGAMLAKPHDYRVIYRLWTVGSNRLLLWADPDYARRFAESCRLGDGEGFEVFALLTNKGYGNAPGKWRIFADRSYESYRWEQQRYWFYYLVFGRMGYNPKCDAEVWRRELRHRFGEAAGDIERAYESGSQILPLIAATCMPSASQWRWWPEMDTGGSLQEYAHTAPSDTAQFYGIRTWKRAENWWREPWDEFPPGFVEDVVAGRVTGRWTPPQVSRHLNQLANQTLQALVNAGRRIPDFSDAEFRATRLDLRVHAYLAQYHAEKAMAAMHLAFFQVTGDSSRLQPARDRMQNALSAWTRIVEATDGVYHDNLVFGHSEGSKRSRGGHHHSGHWKDRLPEIEADVECLRELLYKHQPVAGRYKRFPAESPLQNLPLVAHEPLESVIAGKDLAVRASVTSRRPIKLVRLHFRPLDQTVDWEHVDMRSSGDHFEALVPGEKIEPRWDFMYCFEILDQRGGTFWPSWQGRQPYFVVKVRK